MSGMGVADMGEDAADVLGGFVVGREDGDRMVEFAKKRVVRL